MMIMTLASYKHIKMRSNKSHSPNNWAKKLADYKAK